MSRKLHLPGPAMVVALLALFVALSGTAVAAGVPALAKRALIADNAKKLGGQTSAQLLATANAAAKQAAQSAATAAAQQPGPASTAAGLVVVKNAPVGQLAPTGGNVFSISCDAGQKIMGAGFSSDNAVIIAVASFPVNDTTWSIGLLNLDDSGPANINMHATCLK